MNRTHPQNSKRRFFGQALRLVLSTLAIPTFATRSSRSANSFRDSEKKPALQSDMVFEFVRLAHFDLDKVKEMLDKEPRLVNSCWDWGGGDFETALGGPSHLGNRDIAKYLLQRGARKDIFCAAMLGDNDLIKSFVKSDPDIVNVKGPHEFSLLYHVAISGDVDIAANIKPHLHNVSETCNGALHAAARDGHLPMTEWLLANGVSDLNTVNIFGNTPLQTAEKKGHKDVAEFLKRNGGN